MSNLFDKERAGAILAFLANLEQARSRGLVSLFSAIAQSERLARATLTEEEGIKAGITTPDARSNAKQELAQLTAALGSAVVDGTEPDPKQLARSRSIASFIRNVTALASEDERIKRLGDQLEETRVDNDTNIIGLIGLVLQAGITNIKERLLPQPVQPQDTDLPGSKGLFDDIAEAVAKDGRRSDPHSQHFPPPVEVKRKEKTPPAPKPVESASVPPFSFKIHLENKLKFTAVSFATSDYKGLAQTILPFFEAKFGKHYAEGTNEERAQVFEMILNNSEPELIESVFNRITQKGQARVMQFLGILKRGETPAPTATSTKATVETPKPTATVPTPPTTHRDPHERTTYVIEVSKRLIKEQGALATALQSDASGNWKSRTTINFRYDYFEKRGIVGKKEQARHKEDMAFTELQKEVIALITLCNSVGAKTLEDLFKMSKPNSPQYKVHLNFDQKNDPVCQAIKGVVGLDTIPVRYLIHLGKLIRMNPDVSGKKPTRILELASALERIGIEEDKIRAAAKK